MSKNLILVTGGAGLIGTHILVELVKVNYEVLVLDNFSNSSVHSISKFYKIKILTPAIYTENCARWKKRGL